MFFSFLLVLLLSATVLAQKPIVNTRCLTRYSIRKVAHIKTVNFATTTTKTATAFNTITPRLTITPPRVKKSSTTTTTSTDTVTDPTTTDTYTSFTTTTQTGTATTTDFLTQWITETSTSTVATSTTTIAPPAGFTNLADQPGYVAKKRNAVEEKFAAMSDRAAPTVAYLPFVDEMSPAPQFRARQAKKGPVSEFPVAVSCIRSTTHMRTITSKRTASKTITTTLPARTVWATITVRTSTTITITPARVIELATVTGHATTTITTTEAVTSISTTRQRVDVPAATYLAQCAPKNLVSSVVGQKIGTISFNTAFTLQSIYLTEHAVYDRGYACCAQCDNDKNCAGFAQAPDAGKQKGACYYITTDGRCDKGQSWSDRAHYWNTTGNGYVVGSAQCGLLEFAAGRPPR